MVITKAMKCNISSFISKKDIPEDVKEMFEFEW